MSPTLVIAADGQPLMSCGAAGGPKIITASLQVVLGCLDLDRDIGSAIAAPRCHHQWSPDRAVCEQAIDESVRNRLSDRGHEISLIRSSAVSQGLQFTDGDIISASDPRVPSSAMAL